jgi:hypothetical protein
MSRQAIRPSCTRDLSTSERGLVSVLHELGFGHLESVKIRCGAVVSDPAPILVQVLRFGAADSQPPIRLADFKLKKSMADLFEYIRGVDDGEIRRLEIRHGLPFAMEIERRISRGMPDVKGEHVGVV